MGDNLFEAALLLRSPSQNRTVSDAKTYGFRPKTVCFWFGERTFLGRKP